MSRRPGVGIVPYIEFDRSLDVPLYVQIYAGYRGAIISGQVGLGQRLPSTRTISSQLGISRFPVLTAFDQLLHDGYIVGKVGSGTYVCEQIPEDLTQPISFRKPPSFSRSSASVHGSDDGVSCAPALGPFSVGVSALDYFPRNVFSRLIQRRARTLSPEHMVCNDPAGYGPLRDAVAAYLRTARAVVCDASQVLIVAGSQAGLAISAMALTTPDTLVCVEDPGCRGVRRAMGVANAQVIGVGVDDQGINVATIKRLSDPVKVVCVTPSRQYPLGPAMEATRRLELLHWAASHDAWIVEYDYDSEYRYSTRPLGALQGIDTSDRVIYVGTFGNVLFPTMRLGYVVVPAALQRAFARIRNDLDNGPPMLYQLVLADFMNQGHFGRHLLRMRGVHLARRNALVASLHETAADVLAIGNADAGLNVVAFLPDGIDDQEVVRRATKRGLYPEALSLCYSSSPVRHGLIMGFGGSEECVFPGAVRTLAEVIRSLR